MPLATCFTRQFIFFAALVRLPWVFGLWFWLGLGRLVGLADWLSALGAAALAIAILLKPIAILAHEFVRCFVPIFAI
jgi:hypothetical protein